MTEWSTPPLSDQERELVLMVAAAMWGEEKAAGFLERRLECGAIPWVVSVTVRACKAAMALAGPLTIAAYADARHHVVEPTWERRCVCGGYIDPDSGDCPERVALLEFADGLVAKVAERAGHEGAAG